MLFPSLHSYQVTYRAYYTSKYCFRHCIWKCIAPLLSYWGLHSKASMSDTKLAHTIFNNAHIYLPQIYCMLLGTGRVHSDGTVILWIIAPPIIQPQCWQPVNKEYSTTLRSLVMHTTESQLGSLDGSPFRSNLCIALPSTLTFTSR